MRRCQGALWISKSPQKEIGEKGNFSSTFFQDERTQEFLKSNNSNVFPE